MKKLLLSLIFLAVGLSQVSAQCVYRATLGNPSCGATSSIGSVGSKQYVNLNTTVGNSYCVSINSGSNGGYSYTLSLYNFTATSTSHRVNVYANGGCNWYSGSRSSSTLSMRAAVPTNTTSTAGLCEGSTRTVSANVNCGGFTPTYTENGSGSISGTTYSTGNITANQTVTVVASLGTCTSSRSFTVYAEPNVSNTTSTASICVGGTKTLTGSWSETGGAGTGNWSIVSGGGSISGTTYTPSSAGTVTVRYTVINGYCSAYADRSFTVIANPTAPTISKSPNTTSVCEGTTLTVTSSGGSNGISCSNQYRYSTNNGSSWSSWSNSIPSFTAVVGTNLIESRRYCTGTGCGTVSGNTVSWTVIPSAAVTAVSGTTPLCIGATATYTASGVVLGGGTGAWSSSNTGVATVNASGVVTGVSAGSANIIYTVSGGCNGTATAQQSVTITPDAAVTAVSGTTPLCIGATATYTASGVVLGGGTGAWSSSNTGVATVNASGVVTGVSAGSANIIYTVSGGCNGTATAQQSVTITPDAAVSAVVGAVQLCLGATDTYTASGVVLGGGTGAWSSSNTGVAIVNASGVVTAVGGGSANIIYTVSGGCNGTATAQRFINVISAGTNVTLVNNSVVSATEVCQDGAWTYYASIITQNEFVFAIKKNGNTFDADVVITDAAGTSAFESLGGLGPYRGTWLINRYWNVNLNSGSIVTPVDVRFFVDPAEVAAAQSAATAFLGSSPGATNLVGLTFFKTNGFDYDNSMVVSGDFTFTPTYLSHTSGVINGVTYYELSGITSFSGGTGGFSVNDDASPLPVELLGFDAVAVENTYIDVNWSTATEVNNYGFEVLRGTDGVNFEVITFVDGNGNSSQINEYSYSDTEVQKGVRYYYQLKQIDNDGESETFDVVSAKLDGMGDFSIGNLVPNPSKENAIVRTHIESETSELVKINVYSHVGKLVANYSEQINAGNTELELNIENLSSGTYFIHFEGSFGKETRKLILIK